MARCAFCSKEFRSTTEHENEGVCSICQNLFLTVRFVVRQHDLATVQKIVAAVVSNQTNVL
jgi:hypothetical protein